MELKPGERLDDLLLHNLKIIQSQKVFCFSLDAVLLADFVSIHRGDKVADLGTGNGVIPLLLCTKKIRPAKVYGVEVQPAVADMARRSILYNGLEQEIEIINGDLREITDRLGSGRMDVVVSNPPYAPKNTGQINPGNAKAIARHEIMCTLEDVVRVSSRLLKFRGRLAMVHRPARLTELIVLMCRYGIEPKRLRLVYPRLGGKPNMLLLEGLKGGQRDLKIEPALHIYGEDGEYTPEIMRAYTAGEGEKGNGTI